MTNRVLVSHLGGDKVRQALAVVRQSKMSLVSEVLHSKSQSYSSLIRQRSQLLFVPQSHTIAYCLQTSGIEFDDNSHVTC